MTRTCDQYFEEKRLIALCTNCGVRPIPAGFHIHHKCGNSACVNPRHLVALTAEAHRAVHATKDKAIHERIYRGEWEQIQTAEAEAARLADERRRLDWERFDKLQVALSSRTKVNVILG
jgi:HNH endonuclease